MDLDSLDLSQVEGYGKDIQQSISDNVTNLLSGIRAIDLGDTGKYVTELSLSSSKIAKSLESKGLAKIFAKPKKWLAKYDVVENSIQRLDSAIGNEIERLNTVLNGCYQNSNILKSELIKLESCESELSELINSYTGDDKIKLQAAVHRQKILVSTIALVKQEIAKSVIVISENKEITNQLVEAQENLIPYIKIMLMNALASKSNTEAIKLKKAMKKAANSMIMSTAKEIESNARTLIEDRTDSLVDISTIEEANVVLAKTCKMIADSANLETEENQRLIESLKESMTYISGVDSIEGVVNES